MQEEIFKEKYKELFERLTPTEGLSVSIGRLFADRIEQVMCVG